MAVSFNVTYIMLSFEKVKNQVAFAVQETRMRMKAQATFFT